MSDYNSSLPVRTEANGDIAVKVVDGTITSQTLSIDSSGRVAVKLDDGAGNLITSQANGSARALDVGINVAGVQIDPRAIRTLTSADIVTAAQGAPTTIANAWPVKPTDGINSQSFTASGEAKVSITQAVPAGTNAIGSVLANIQVAGAAVTTLNPVPVTLQAAPGTHINDYKAASSVAAAASDSHDYTVTAGKTLYLNQIESSASGKAKMIVSVETGVATGVFTTSFAKFNSTATPNMNVSIQNATIVAAGVRVRVIMSNLDKSALDLYSTISGYEI